MKKTPKQYIAQVLERPEIHPFPWRAPASTFDRIEELSKSTGVPVNSLLTAAAEMFADQSRTMVRKFKTKE